MVEPTEQQVEAAYQAAGELIGLPNGANVRDYLVGDETGDERKAALARLKAADEEAERENRDLVRQVVRAALNA